MSNAREQFLDVSNVTSLEDITLHDHLSNVSCLNMPNATEQFLNVSNATSMEDTSLYDHLSNVSRPNGFSNSNADVLSLIVPLTAFGVVVNLAAFAYVLWSPKIKRPLKVTLANLIGSDCIFLMAFAIAGFTQLGGILEISFCSVLAVLLMAPVPLSYTAILWMAIHNWLAVKTVSPVQTILTTRRSVIATIIAWTVIFFTSIFAMALTERKSVGKCSAVAEFPNFLQIAFATYSFLCSFGMAALNVAVAKKVRSSCRIGVTPTLTSESSPRVEPRADFRRFGDALHQPRLSSARCTPNVRNVFAVGIHNNPISSLAGNSSGSSPTPLTARHPYHSESNPNTGPDAGSITKAVRSANLSGMTVYRSTHLRVPSRPTPNTCSPRESPDGPTRFYGMRATPLVASRHVNAESSHKDSPSERPPSHLSTPRHLEFSPFVQTQHPNSDNSSTTSTNVSSERAAPAKERISPNSAGQPRPDEHSPSVVEQQPKAWLSPRKRATIKTLTILATWNAALTLPMLCCWLYLATSKDQAKGRWFEIIYKAATFLVPLNAISNPFLYAWRFVEWRKLGSDCTQSCPHIGN